MGSNAPASHQFNLNSTMYVSSDALYNWVATFATNKFYPKAEAFMSFITLSNEAATCYVHPAKLATAHKNVCLLITLVIQKRYYGLLMFCLSWNK